MKRLELQNKSVLDKFVSFGESLKEKTRTALKNRITSDLRNIYDTIHKGEEPYYFPNEDEDLAVKLSDITKTEYYVGLEVADQTEDYMFHETRLLTEIHLTLDGSIFIYLENDNENEEMNLNDISTDDVFGICNILDGAYYSLCKGEK